MRKKVGKDRPIMYNQLYHDTMGGSQVVLGGLPSEIS